MTQKLDFVKAELAWTQACQDRDREITNIKNDISSIKDQLALLLAANGIGKVEKVKRANRIKAQRTTEVSEDKRKTAEKRKIMAEAKRLAEEEKMNTEEQEKASELARQERAKMEKENAVIKDCENQIKILAKKVPELSLPGRIDKARVRYEGGQRPSRQDQGRERNWKRGTSRNREDSNFRDGSQDGRTLDDSYRKDGWVVKDDPDGSHDGNQQTPPRGGNHRKPHHMGSKGDRVRQEGWHGIGIEDQQDKGRCDRIRGLQKS